MASFLYFLPGVDQKTLVHDGRLNHVELRRWGLAETMADVFEIPNHCALTRLDGQGPDKGPGMVLTIHPGSQAGQIPRVPSFNAESQTWWQTGKSENEPWIGFQTDAIPQPEDLERNDAISGYRFADRFSRTWRMPVIRGRENQYGSLPVDYDWSSGSFTPGKILRQQFEQLWNDSAKVWDHLYTEGFNCPEEFIVSFVARCLAVNYRIGPRELEALRRAGQPAFDNRNLNDWAGMACDLPAITEYAVQKKMTVYQAAQSGTRSLAGDPAGTVNIDRAAGNSE